MVKVSLTDLDTLCNGLYDLLVLTYLQKLALENTSWILFEDGGVKISHSAALAFLWEQQHQTLARLKLLIEEDTFSSPLTS